VSGHVVCVGAATLDTIAAVERHPEPDERVEATEVATAGGGPAATAAVALARLGLPVSLIASVGDDAEGLEIAAGLAGEGVDLFELAVAPGARSARSSILVDVLAGTRSIAAYPGTAGPPALTKRGAKLCREAEWVHLDHVGYTVRRELPPGSRLSIDAGNPIEGLELRGMALFAPTEASLAALYGGATLERGLELALEAGAETVVVTRGARGSVAATHDGERAASDGFPVSVRSTLGAGDVFHGALLAALVEDRPLRDALARANTAAALSCRALDGRSAIPTADELEAALAQ
jgi:sulfofructose kinase